MTLIIVWTIVIRVIVPIGITIGIVSTHTVTIESVHFFDHHFQPVHFLSQYLQFAFQFRLQIILLH